MAEPKTTGTEARAVAGAITSMGLSDMIANLAIGIAKGQAELDFECMKIARFMGDAQIAFGKRPGSDEAELHSLIELGFTPNFYQFVDTVLELRVAVSTRFEESVEQESSSTNLVETESASSSSSSSSSNSASSSWGYNWGWGWWNWGLGVHSGSSSNASSSSSSSSFKQKNLALTTVDAKYASTYNYAVEASSVVKTKIVPVPPPAILEELVRARVQQRKEWERLARLAIAAQVIVNGQLTLLASMTTDAGKLGTATTQANKDLAAALEAAAARLTEGHASITAEQWGIGGTVADRAAADAHLVTVGDKARALKDLYTDSPTGDLAALRLAFTGALAGYKLTLDAVGGKLAAIASTLALPAGK